MFPNYVLTRRYEEPEGFYKGLVAANPDFAAMFNHQREFMRDRTNISISPTSSNDLVSDKLRR